MIIPASRWAPLALMTAVLTLGGCEDAGNNPDPSPSVGLNLAPDIDVAPNPLHFGSASEAGEQLAGTLTISNVGASTLEIITVEVTEGGDVFELTTSLSLPFNLSAGESQILDLIAEPVSADDVGVLRITSNDEDELAIDVSLEAGLGSASPTQATPPEDTPTVDTPPQQTLPPGTWGQVTPPPDTSEEGTPPDNTLGEITPPDKTPDEGTPPDRTPGEGTPPDTTPGEGTPPDTTPGEGTPPDTTPGGETFTPIAESPTQAPTPTATPEPDVDEDGFTPGDGDCDDNDPTSYPGGEETCDGRDNDCNGSVDDFATDAIPFYLDLDNDTFGDNANQAIGCDVLPGYVENNQDCDDGNAAINPGAEETCNGLDDNCDGLVDNEPTDPNTYYLDGDGDTWGQGAQTTQACTAPDGYTDRPGDCDDSATNVNPEAPDSCDDIDNDCDTVVDEEGQSTWYIDGDSDGWGTDSQTQQACGQPDGFAPRPGDCDDSNAAVSPGAAEICNEADEDCDEAIDEGLDTDGDGFTTCGGDCDEGNAAINPDAVERCDGQDEDCDGIVDNGFDLDEDGFTSCGSDDTPRDCNDNAATIYPGADEACNLGDDDCDSLVDEGVKITFYRDADEDGYGRESPTVQACEAPDGYAAQTGDCNDLNDAVYPNAIEFCDQQDNDCNGEVDEGVTTTYYLDADGDTYGASASSQQACFPPSSSYVTRGNDCNDLDNIVYPNAAEICDGKDNDCNGATDEGFDADSDGVAVCEGDCDDADAEVYAGAAESCDAKDNNCNGVIDEGYDVDSDGVTACGNDIIPPDCDDTDDQVRPGLPEVCDSKDNDCDGNADEGYDQDGDGFSVCNGDCDDSDPAINPAAPDEPFDTIDSNCDGSDGGAVGAIYVRANAQDGGDGSKESPFNDLQVGIDEATSLGASYVLVAGGSYHGSITLAPGQNILGGYNPAFNQRNPNVHVSEIVGDAPTSSAPGAVNAHGISGDSTLFEGFRVIATAGSAPQASATGLFAQDSTDALTVHLVDFIVGPGNAGGNGNNGNEGDAGNHGAPGADATTLSTACSGLPVGATGGQRTCQNAPVHGGDGGGLLCPTESAFQPDGSDGSYGGALGGLGAADGAINSSYPNGCGTCYIGGDWGSAEHGEDGDSGEDGGSGLGGTADNFSFAGGLFDPDDGALGDFGEPGGGGGGGGTAGGAQSTSCGDSHAGGMGGGGGSGACGGDPGEGGTGGGGSFGVVLYYTSAPATVPQIIDNVIDVSDGGAGGKGGDGGLGGLGGLGGSGGEDRTNGAWCSGRGGTGGNGGDGGTGGGGGGGAGGPSYGIFLHGAATTPDYATENLIGVGRGGRGGRGGFGGRGIYGEDGEDGTAGAIVSQ